MHIMNYARFIWERQLIEIIIIIGLLIIIIIISSLLPDLQQAGTARHYRVNKKPKAY